MAGGKTRLQEDLELLATYRLARMSVRTMAMLLDRTPKWVEARIAEMEAQEAPELVTKAEFGRRRGMKSPVLSRHISKGHIHGPALVEVAPGQVRINVQIADAQLAQPRPRGAPRGPTRRKAVSAPVGASRPNVAAQRIVVPPPPFLNACSPARRAPPKPRPSAPAAAVPVLARIKPVTERVARWTAQYLARGVQLEELAELFDRDPIALGRAVEALA